MSVHERRDSSIAFRIIAFETLLVTSTHSVQGQAPPQSRDRARAEWTEAAQPPIAQAQGRDGDSVQVLQTRTPDGSNGALLLAKQASTELHGGRRIDEQQELALPAPMLIRTITASRDLCGRQLGAANHVHHFVSIAENHILPSALHALSAARSRNCRVQVQRCAEPRDTPRRKFSEAAPPQGYEPELQRRNPTRRARLRRPRPRVPAA